MYFTNPMNSKLQTTINQADGATSIKLAGVLDEDNRLTELVDRVGKGRTVINLGEVDRINSCGIRDWVNWLTSIEARGTQPVLTECSPAIVAQLNLVKNFCGGGVVKSFYVPYHCPNCDEEKLLLIDVADLGPPPHEPPTCRCDDCEAVMQFDDMPDQYFAFLTARHRESAQELDKEGTPGARGSSASIKNRTRQSQPQLTTRKSTPSLSSFQTKRPSSPPVVANGAVRISQPLDRAPAVAPPSGMMLKVVIGLLVCTIAVLAFILLT
jgi:anti-anti-sigma regulatory factor